MCGIGVTASSSRLCHAGWIDSARAGWAPQKQRRIYHFRNRHGFTDEADQAFNRLWSADGLTWDELEAICASAGQPDSHS